MQRCVGGKNGEQKKAPSNPSDWYNIHPIVSNDIFEGKNKGTLHVLLGKAWHPAVDGKIHKSPAASLLHLHMRCLLPSFYLALFPALELSSQLWLLQLILIQKNILVIPLMEM